MTDRLSLLTDQAADSRLDLATRIAARDELTRHYASLAASTTTVIRYPGMFDEKTREAVLGAPAGSDALEATHAAYDATIRDAWRDGQIPDRGTLDEAYENYETQLRDSWQR